MPLRCPLAGCSQSASRLWLYPAPSIACPIQPARGCAMRVGGSWPALPRLADHRAARVIKCPAARTSIHNLRLKRVWITRHLVRFLNHDLIYMSVNLFVSGGIDGPKATPAHRPMDCLAAWGLSVTIPASAFLRPQELESFPISSFLFTLEVRAHRSCMLGRRTCERGKLQA